MVDPSFDQNSPPNPALRSHWWAPVNLVAAPLVGIAALLGLVFTAWISSYGITLPGVRMMLTWLLPLGVALGLALGLLQALALRGRVAILPWTAATAAGLALDAALIAAAWILRSWGEQPAAVSHLPGWGVLLAQAGFWLLAVGHGCALAGVQSLALPSKPSRAAWLGGAGLTWSLLTPFAYILTEQWWSALALALPLPVDEGVLYLPFLLMALPYVIVTTRLWRRAG